MRHALSSVVIVLLFAGPACSGDPLSDLRFDPDDPLPDVDAGTDTGDAESATPSDADRDADLAPGFAFELGSRGSFTPWEDGGELPVIAGFQGGHHTEHTARVSGIGADELNDSIISVEVTQGGTMPLAEGAWRFDRGQYRSLDGAWLTPVPNVVFATEPPIGEEVDLTASAELADGRTRDLRLTMTLVDAGR